MLKPVFLLAAALAAAPLANAQGAVSCNDVADTLDAAAFDFEDIIGEEVDEYIFSSELTLPGANACTLQLDWDSIMFCLWNHASEASARSAYDQLTAIVGNCLAGWSTESVFDDPDVPATALMYNFRSGAGDFADMEVMLHMDRYEEDGVVGYEVWYELAYYLL
jgi:hypothetical protein